MTAAAAKYGYLQESADLVTKERYKRRICLFYTKGEYYLTEIKENTMDKNTKRRTYMRGYMRGRRLDPQYRAAERIRDRDRKRRIRAAAKAERERLNHQAAQNRPESTQ